MTVIGTIINASQERLINASREQPLTVLSVTVEGKLQFAFPASIKDWILFLEEKCKVQFLNDFRYGNIEKLLQDGMSSGNPFLVNCQMPLQPRGDSWFVFMATKSFPLTQTIQWQLSYMVHNILTVAGVPLGGMLQIQSQLSDMPMDLVHNDRALTINLRQASDLLRSPHLRNIGLIIISKIYTGMEFDMAQVSGLTI